VSNACNGRFLVFQINLPTSRTSRRMTIVALECSRRNKSTIGTARSARRVSMDRSRTTLTWPAELTRTKSRCRTPINDHVHDRLLRPRFSRRIFFIFVELFCDYSVAYPFCRKLMRGCNSTGFVCLLVYFCCKDFIPLSSQQPTVFFLYSSTFLLCAG
jgi:hypothetical protein